MSALRISDTLGFQQGAGASIWTHTHTHTIVATVVSGRPSTAKLTWDALSLRGYPPLAPGCNQDADGIQLTQARTDKLPMTAIIPLSFIKISKLTVHEGLDLRVDHLRAADVCHPEHELEDAIPTRNDGALRDEDGAAPLLGVRDAAAGTGQH